jgi:acetolactate synthase I/II/III large subunit
VRKEAAEGPVVCVTGDGSWLMSSHELTTAVQLRLPMLFVILNDARLGMVYHGQRMTGACSIGHELPPVNFADMAQACGARGIRLQTVEQLLALDKADLFEDGPVVLELCVDPETAPPMHARVEQLKQVARIF